MNKKRNSSAYNRDVSRRKALRKRRLSEEIYYDGKEHPYYDNLHQYSKNKIHCSCPLCTTKTKNKGRRGHENYNPTWNYKTSEKRKLMSMEYDKAEFFEEEEECVE